MGVVYLAVDENLNRSVALKVIAPQMSGDDEARRRFIREARTAAAIEHPNVLPIYRVGDVDGLLYIAMRYVDGPTLHDVIRREVFLDVPRALTIMQQVASALDIAHHREIIHRDVKPQNILLASHGDSEHAYLSDFGLARLIADTGLTRTGESLGTPSYMAPEQILGKDVDHRADIYSLGCVLYETLTGELPFPVETRHAIYYAHVNSEPPRASEMNSSLAPAIDQVILKALAKQPDDRFETAGALTRAAEAALGPRQQWPASVSGRTDKPRTRASDEDVDASEPPLGGVGVVEVRSGRTEFYVRGEKYVTGAAGTRCYHDLVKQLGTPLRRRRSFALHPASWRRCANCTLERASPNCEPASRKWLSKRCS
jgi:serine/threonine protein kinase